MDSGAQTVDLRQVRFTAELVSCIAPEVARLYRVVPLSNERHRLLVAVADLEDLDRLVSLAQQLQRDLELRLAEEAQLDRAIEQLYGRAR